MGTQIQHTAQATTERKRSWRDDLAAKHQITQARLQVMFEPKGDTEEHL